MADTFTPAERSAIMRRVRSSGNVSTELRLIALLRAARLTGWRRRAALPGRPDFIFPAGRVAVFVDGCFWHGCPRCGRLPTTRVDYWRAKIDRNRRRDRAVSRLLRARGWSVLRIRECALRRRPASVVARVRKALQTP